MLAVGAATHAETTAACHVKHSTANKVMSRNLGLRVVAVRNRARKGNILFCFVFRDGGGEGAFEREHYFKGQLQQFMETAPATASNGQQPQKVPYSDGRRAQVAIKRSCGESAMIRHCHTSCVLVQP